MADDDSFKFWNAILIALVTVLAALVAWRASVAGDAAGDNDYDGLRSLVSVQEVQTLGTVEAYVHSQAYANYRRYDETATTLNEELEEASGKEAVELRRKKREAEVLVDAKLKMFPNKFIERQAKSDQSSYNQPESHSRPGTRSPFRRRRGLSHQNRALASGRSLSHAGAGLPDPGRGL